MKLGQWDDDLFRCEFGGFRWTFSEFSIFVYDMNHNRLFHTAVEGRD